MVVLRSLYSFLTDGQAVSYLVVFSIVFQEHFESEPDVFILTLIILDLSSAPLMIGTNALYPLYEQGYCKSSPHLSIQVYTGTCNISGGDQKPPISCLLVDCLLWLWPWLWPYYLKSGVTKLMAETKAKKHPRYPWIVKFVSFGRISMVSMLNFKIKIL